MNEEYEFETKGFLRTTTKTDYKLVLNQNADLNQLQKQEKMVFDFLFKKVSQTAEVTFEQLEEYSKKENKSFESFWKKWEKQIEKNIEKDSLFEEADSDKILFRVTPLFFFLGLLIGSVLMGPENFIMILLASIFLMIIYALSLLSHRRRTMAGAEENNKWKAFKKFIKDFSNIKNESIPALVIWEHYLVYAITFDIAKEVLKSLELVYPGLRDQNHQFGQGWYVYHTRGSVAPDFNKSFATMTTSISQSVSTSVQTATGVSSSGSGAGGGFSGGGGGGASGGGGGGAR